MVYWASPTARLLARYLAGRGGGPLFLTTGRSRQPTSRRDVYAPTGQARLAYRTRGCKRSDVTPAGGLCTSCVIRRFRIWRRVERRR